MCQVMSSSAGPSGPGPQLRRGRRNLHGHARVGGPEATSMRPFAALLVLALLAPAAVAQQNPQRFEANQTRRTAARVTPGDYKGLFCNEEDWYALEVGAGQRLEVQVAFRHAEGDLELEVQDARGRT